MEEPLPIPADVPRLPDAGPEIPLWAGVAMFVLRDGAGVSNLDADRDEIGGLSTKEVSVVLVMQKLRAER